MKHKRFTIPSALIKSLVLGGCLLAPSLTPSAYAEPSALEILDQADDKLDIKGSQLDLEMLVYRNNELRKTYRMTLHYKDADHTMAETTYPPRNEGEKMLQAGRRNYWMFLPNINRAIRISESNSFSNSDFSNADILSPRLSNEYNAKLIGSEKLRGDDAFKLELLARDESTPYAKIIYWIRKSDYFPLRRNYYTASQQLLKRLEMRASSSLMNGRPDTLLMSSVLELDKKTVIRYVKYAPNMAFPADMFSETSLMKR